MSKRPFTDFDLPTRHIPKGSKHFVPPKTRDSAEKERRKELPKGTLLTEFQQTGIQISALMLGILQDPHDIESASETITPASLNTSWYLFAQNVLEVMRKRLKLARLATDDPEQRPTSYMLHHQATNLFAGMAGEARGLVVATAHGLESIADYKKRVARGVGHASLVLDSVSIGDKVGYGDIQANDFDLQNMSRLRGLKALEQARNLHLVTGEVPSLAGLADPDSGVAVHLRRTATTPVVEAWEEAYEIAA